MWKKLFFIFAIIAIAASNELTEGIVEEIEDFVRSKLQNLFPKA